MLEFENCIFLCPHLIRDVRIVVVLVTCGIVIFAVVDVVTIVVVVVAAAADVVVAVERTLDTENVCVYFETYSNYMFSVTLVKLSFYGWMVHICTLKIHKTLRFVEKIATFEWKNN